MPVIFDKTPGSINIARAKAHAERIGGPMKIRMLVTHQTARDGTHVITYEAGQVYEVDESTGKRWIGKGMAEDDKMIVGPAEVKAPDKPKKEKAKK